MTGRWTPPGPTCHMVYRVIAWSAQNAPQGRAGGGRWWHGTTLWATLGATPLVPRRPSMKQRCLHARAMSLLHARISEVLVSV